MNISLFTLALERLQSSDWRLFEQLASEFLADTFPQLRTMANPSGDRGRDSELFQPDGKPFICFQYSVQKAWKEKIKQTASRLTEEFPDMKILVYLTNQEIGAKADLLKRDLLNNGLSLDVRDRNWFIERARESTVCEDAAEDLSDRIARPYLSEEGIISKPSSALTSQEAQAALLYLGLQWQDDITDKGLTKLSFDALVRAALRNSHAQCRVPRATVHDIIQGYLPGVNRERLSHHVNAALKRLTKRYIRHWQQEDGFCLMHEEHQKILARLAKKELEELSFCEEIKHHCSELLYVIEGSDKPDLTDLQERIPRIIEKLLLHRGEAFVSSVLTGKLDGLDFNRDLKDIIIEDLSAHRPNNRDSTSHLPGIIALTVHSLLTQPAESVQQYLRRLSNSYTLFSFLRETPDVQSATRKLFSHGKVWLDTTVLLPLFAEYLQENETERRLKRTFLACREAGIELCVTEGIIQEINSHMYNALKCSKTRAQLWRGRIPYLYYQYLSTGQAPSEFSRWVYLFRGREHQEKDIAQFLYEDFNIQTIQLSEEAEKVDDNLRWAAERLWTEAHRRRRQNTQQEDDVITEQLIKHDIETYLGVIYLRSKEQITEFGYKHWLLTFDKIAWQIRDSLREEFKSQTPPSPLLSLDFLVNNLTFGAIRHQIARDEEQTLPIILDVEMSESMPHDILDIADQVRKDNEGFPERVIKRKVRDAINRTRAMDYYQSRQ